MITNWKVQNIIFNLAISGAEEMNKTLSISTSVMASMHKRPGQSTF